VCDERWAVLDELHLDAPPDALAASPPGRA
jgi:hypothetical protein